jgi:N-glycosylase/DNA lyase
MGTAVAENAHFSAESDPGLIELKVDDQVLRFQWGLPHELGTAAFWVEQTRRRSPQGGHRLGETLAEEVVACLLGGYGVRAWVGLAAFKRLRRRGLVSPCDPPSSKHLEAALAEPLSVDGYGPIRYRFPNQRAERIAAALRILSEESPPTNGHELRDWLLGISGIGPKTASWVARNWSGGDGIAIIDVHIHRAGLAAGFFPDHWKLPRDYGRFEQAFCAVAQLGGVSSAALDARIWRDLAYLGSAKRLLLG